MQSNRSSEPILTQDTISDEAMDMGGEEFLFYVYDEITYREILDKELKALDIPASAFCMENNIRCYAFELKDPMNIYKVIMGEKIGTALHR